MPELVRDEFNAYKKTLLQDHLYELIFKEGQQSQHSSSSTSFTSNGLADMPSLGPVSDSGLSVHLQEMESSVFELIAEVIL